VAVASVGLLPAGCHVPSPINVSHHVHGHRVRSIVVTLETWPPCP